LTHFFLEALASIDIGSAVVEGAMRVRPSPTSRSRHRASIDHDAAAHVAVKSTILPQHGEMTTEAPR
jgi:hypothetical protein